MLNTCAESPQTTSSDMPASGICRSWIFVVYTWNMTTCATSHTYFDIYLVYDTPCHMSGICLVYVWHIMMFSESFGNMSGICLEYVWHMFSESFGHMPGIYLTYDFVCDMPGPSGCGSGNTIGPACTRFSGIMGFNVMVTVQRAPRPRPPGLLAGGLP